MTKRLKYISLLIAVFLFALTAWAEQWRLHPTYDGNLNRLIDTPDYLYVLSYNQPWIEGTADYGRISLGLFRYDKEGEELIALNKSNLLSDNVIQTAEYNHDKGYLLVVHDDGDIDLLYDNGKTVNVPGFRLADSSFDRMVNDVTFDPAAGLAYLSTNFGFVTVDDSRGEIAMTRNYGVPVYSAQVFRDKLFLITDNGLLYGNPKAFTLSDMTVFSALPALRKIRAAGDRLYIWNGYLPDCHLWYIEDTSAVGQNNHFLATPVMDIFLGKDGLQLISSNELVNIDGKSHDVTRTGLSSDDAGKITASWNGREIWIDNGRDGISMKQVSGDQWTLRIEKLFPNASAAFIADDLTYHPSYGMLVRNHGNGRLFSTQGNTVPDLLSALDNLEWKHLSNVYSGNPHPAIEVYNPNSVLVDPLDRNVIYTGSSLHGFQKLDLSDMSKSIRVTKENDSYAAQPGVIATDPVMSKMESLNCYVPGGFDASNNLWMGFYNFDNNSAGKGIELCMWPAADRAASTSSNAYRPMKRIVVDGLGGTAAFRILPLVKAPNQNLIVVTGAEQPYTIAIIDTGGTPDNAADDRVVKSESFIDQDGESVSVADIYFAFEDPSTGDIWIGNDNGVFRFDPQEFLKNPTRVNRIKVARNDGTNLADYLLNAASVTAMATDGAGNRWFATNGGGIVCTTSTGSDVRKTYTKGNSMLPDDRVYSLCYNPANNSMMISTASGLAELYLSSAGVEGEDLKVYPNPVRPEWYGFVTIEGLPDGAVVKVTDSAGNLVRELEPAVGGETKWDVTNAGNKRVRAGVYYILASGGNNSENYSASAKVVVIN